MRSKIGKTVRNRFKRQLGVRLPGFNGISDAIVPQGWAVYGLEIAPDLVMYVVLAILPREDRFLIEAAWARNGLYPSNASVLWPGGLPRGSMIVERAKGGEFAFRIDELWKRGYTWDLVPQRTLDEMIAEQNQVIETGVIPPEPSLEEALAKVNPMVDDAIAKIEQYLLPYFDEVAAQFGYNEKKASDLAKKKPLADARNAH